MSPRFKPGDEVKFKDKLWEKKKISGLGGGLFGKATTETSTNHFVVNGYNIQDKDYGEAGVEYGLVDFPWLVYGDEIQAVCDEEI